MNSSQTSTCSRCQSPLSDELSQSLCPRCVMAMNLAEPTLENASLTAPTIEELAPSFPQLELLSLLGRGGMGIVYLARQPQLDRTVALKILAPECSDDPRFAERFQREAISLAKIDHPNIVTIFDTGVSDGHYYLLMEYVEGLNLREAMAGEKMAPAEALAIVPEICAGLQYAHDHGIVHRDIKPENILLDKKGRVKIADFGIAKLIHGPELDSPPSEQQAQDLTQESKLGTPKYMAPEQGHAPEETDHRADIYALGAVLYEMLTGERPQEDLLAPSQKVQIDVRLDEVVLRALQKEPELRFQTAHEFSTVVQTLSEQSAGTTKTSTQRTSPLDEPFRGPVQKWRKWFAVPWAIEREGLIKPNWPIIISLCSVCLFIIWGGINAIFLKPWLSNGMLDILRLITTVLTILWPFLAYRFTRARLLEKKRLLGLGERSNNQWLYSTQSFVLAITIASLIQSFYMPFRVASDRMSPHLDKGSLVIVERFNRHFIKGDIISYKEGKKDFLGLVAKTRAVNDSSKNLLVTDYRGKEVNVSIQNVYGRVKFGNSRPKVNQLPVASQTLSLANYDQGLSETAMEELRQNDVESIDLTDSALNEEALQLLAQKKNLKTLKIGRTIGSKAPALTDEALRIIADCRTLEFIHLHRQDITDDGIRHLANLPNLKKLQLGGTKVTGRRLFELSNLTWLRLDSTPVTDQALASITYLEALEQLYLDGTQISDKGLQNLRPDRLGYLRVLNLHNTQVTAQGLAKLKKNFPELAIGANKDLLEGVEKLDVKK